MLRQTDKPFKLFAIDLLPSPSPSNSYLLLINETDVELD